ncbi:MFS transporter [Amycolatopsis japonica]|uniref:MFS transporter n=1 Tax=Amycolatopsis japonica TaxID=208439 RepID=UPI0036725B65
MRRWGPLITVCAGAVMLLLDVTIVNVALPEAAVELSATFTDLQWVLDGYVLALAALLLGTGALADRFGRRRVYCAALATFGLASLCCGLAPSPELLTAARTVQGLGAAGMFATAPALLNDTYRGRSRGIAFGVWGGVSAAAAAAGPVVGGVVTHFLGWRWIFLVNVPICLAALLLAPRVLPRSAGDSGRRLDLVGTVLFTFASGSLVYGLIRGNELGWTSPASVALFGGSVLAMAAFLLTERRRSFPVVDPRLLRDGRFAGISLAAITMTVAAYSYLLYVSLWLQSRDGLSPLLTGLVMAPLGFAAMVTALAKGKRGSSIRPRTPIACGLVFVGAGGLVMASAGPGPLWPWVLIGTTLTGVGAGLVSPLLASTALSIVSREQAGMASAVNAACRQFGTALGIALFGALFPHFGLRVLFLVSTGVAVTGAALTWVLLREVQQRQPKNTPADHVGRRQRSRS